MSPMTLSPGKIRSLQSLSTPNGIFEILAIDHRDSLRVLLCPGNPDSVPADEITDFKHAVIKSIAPHASGVMLDPEYSAGQAIVANSLPGQVGFLSALEEQGYLDDPHARSSTFLTGWTVEKAKRLGAGGIKLLLFYHPDAGEAANRQENAVKSTVADCARYEIPLFLEPIFYSIDDAISVDSAEIGGHRQRIVLETVRRLGALGPDILKIPFPIDASHQPDRESWKDACAELDDVSPVPWALLSAGDPYEIFRDQLQIGCENGCSGFMAGRALWKEAVTADPTQRKSALESLALPRFQELSQIASTCGRDWRKRVEYPRVGEGWYREY